MVDGGGLEIGWEWALPIVIVRRRRNEIAVESMAIEGGQKRNVGDDWEKKLARRLLSPSAKLRNGW